MSWNQGLLQYLKNPESNKLVLEHCNDWILIHDLFPKSKTHLLMIPTAPIDNVWDLKQEHLPLLRMLQTKADELASTYGVHGEGSKFIIGFHAIPSMRHLHLHLLSNDLTGHALKTKHHYLSFTTPFLIPISTVISDLEGHGKLNTTRDRLKVYLDGPIICHICQKLLKNTPRLKEHLLVHALPAKGIQSHPNK